jgi:hypothetical protein
MMVALALVTNTPNRVTELFGAIARVASANTVLNCMSNAVQVLSQAESKDRETNEASPWFAIVVPGTDICFLRSLDHYMILRPMAR